MTTAPSPPPAFVQSILIRLLRSPLHGLLSRNLLLLGFSGRRSGRRYQIPVAYVPADASVLIATQARWWKNLSGGAPVAVLLRGRRVTGNAEVAEDVPRHEADLRRMLRGANQVARFMQVTLDRTGAPNPSELAAAIERGWMVVRVNLPHS